eukprot:765856-Hanusia_phi.AAC.2
MERNPPVNVRPIQIMAHIPQVFNPLRVLLCTRRAPEGGAYPHVRRLQVPQFQAVHCHPQVLQVVHDDAPARHRPAVCPCIPGIHDRLERIECPGILQADQGHGGPKARAVIKCPLHDSTQGQVQVLPMFDVLVPEVIIPVSIV